jgi:hypothetical protein
LRLADTLLTKRDTILLLGGDSGFQQPHTEEWKLNHSKRMKGNYEKSCNAFYGKKHTKELKEKWSQKRKGKSFIELHGQEKARLSSEASRISHLGLRWLYNPINKETIQVHFSKINDFISKGFLLGRKPKEV